MTNHWNLTDHTKKESFKTPSGYFETLSPRVMQRIQEYEQQKARRRKLQLHIISYAVAATAALFLVFGSVWMNSGTTPEVTEVAYEDTYLDDMVNYAMLDYYTLDEYIQDTNL